MHVTVDVDVVLLLCFVAGEDELICSSHYACFGDRYNDMNTLYRLGLQFFKGCAALTPLSDLLLSRP